MDPEEAVSLGVSTVLNLDNFDRPDVPAQTRYDSEIALREFNKFECSRQRLLSTLRTERNRYGRTPSAKAATEYTPPEYPPRQRFGLPVSKFEYDSASTYDESVARLSTDIAMLKKPSLGGERPTHASTITKFDAGRPQSTFHRKQKNGGVSALVRKKADLETSVASERRARAASLATLKRQSQKIIAGDTAPSGYGLATQKKQLGPEQELELGARAADLNRSLTRSEQALATLDRLENERIDRQAARTALSDLEHERAAARRLQRHVGTALDATTQRLLKQTLHAEHVAEIEVQSQSRHRELAARIAVKKERAELVRVRRAEAANIGQQLGKACSSFREARRRERDTKAGRPVFVSHMIEASDRARLESMRSR